VIIRTRITTNEFCITWASQAGVDYQVRGKTNITDATWDTVSPVIRATGTETTFCVSLTDPHHFFQVIQVGGSGGGTNQFSISLSRLPAGAGFLLTWTAPPNQRFQVEYSFTMPATNWTSFTNVVTSATSNYSFIDDGSQTGGLTPGRYYRVRQLP
jgi:hypothetical protein